MAQASLTSKEIAELMKGISQLVSVKRIVKNIDEDTLVDILYKFENAGKSDDEILRASEDSHDSFQPRVGNCECCDD
jgi:DNA-binding TFAR19-related protein (PDSD5 family)|tara:strand:+ start:248 stop:478 length:231 start_codon:yes stop_codon:yes gene_type:complete